jgi:hypothetical protein
MIGPALGVRSCVVSRTHRAHSRPLSLRRNQQASIPEELLQASRSARTWVKSGRCDTSSCVEASFSSDGIAVRNSTDPNGLMVHFTREEWIAFVGGVRDGDFDFGLVPTTTD